jgi:23S rRNA-/tRNA-specific pseudouridylate synthase
MINTTIYQNDNFLLIWKPAGIPSTFGKEESFLDYMKKKSESPFTLTPLSELLPAELVSFAEGFLEEGLKSNKIEQNRKKWGTIKTQEQLNQTIRHQVDIFGQGQEYGLLNRLDNETAGFLYFAKSQQSYTHFKSLQKSGKINKYYLAQTYGKFEGQHTERRIKFPIKHLSATKMIAIKNPRDQLKGRGKQHQVITQVELLQYDKKNDISTLLVTITKGIRHQIRVHLASN